MHKSGRKTEAGENDGTGGQAGRVRERAEEQGS